MAQLEFYGISVRQGCDPMQSDALLKIAGKCSRGLPRDSNAQCCHLALPQAEHAGRGRAAHLARLLSGDVSNNGAHAADCADGHQINTDDKAANWQRLLSHLQPATCVSHLHLDLCSLCKRDRSTANRFRGSHQLV